MTTVGEVLQLPSLSGCTILSGLSGLDRKVMGWSFLQDFTASPWIREGELIMSAALPTGKSTSNKASDWLQTIIDAKVAALGIRRAGPDGRPPSLLLEIGDRNNFTIFDMPTGLILPKVREDVFELVLARKAASLRKALDTLSLLTTSTVEGWVTGFVEQIGIAFDNPVLIETCDMHYVASSPAHDQVTAKALSMRRSDICTMELYSRLNSDSEFERDPNWRLRFLRHTLLVDGREYEQLTFPVENGDHLFGYLSLIQVNKVFDYDDSLVMLATLDATCLISHRDTTYEVQEEVKQELLRLIITPELGQEAKSKAKLYGFDYHNPLFCAIARPTANALCEPDWRFNDGLVTHITNELRQIDKKVFCVRYHSSLVIFCHIDGSCTEEEPCSKKSTYRVALESIIKVIGKVKNCPDMRIGAGRPGSGMEATRISYEEAASALSIADRFNLPLSAVSDPVIYSDIRYFQLIDSLLQNEEKARLFCLDILGRFMEQNLKTEEEYLRTLEAYLYYGRNLSDIQRNIGIHRNTVKYRIEKIQEVLGVDLNDIRASVSIWVALQLRKILLLKNNGT